MKSISTGRPLSEASVTSRPCWSTSVTAGRQSLELAAGEDPGSATSVERGEAAASPAAIISIKATIADRRRILVGSKSATIMLARRRLRSTARAGLGAHRIADALAHFHHAQAVERGDRWCAARAHGVREGGDFVGERIAFAEIDLLSGNFRVDPSGRRRRLAVDLDAA